MFSNTFFVLGKQFWLLLNNSLKLFWWWAELSPGAFGDTVMHSRNLPVLITGILTSNGRYLCEQCTSNRTEISNGTIWFQNSVQATERFTRNSFICPIQLQPVPVPKWVMVSGAVFSFICVMLEVKWDSVRGQVGEEEVGQKWEHLMENKYYEG